MAAHMSSFLIILVFLTWFFSFSGIYYFKKGFNKPKQTYFTQMMQI